MNSAVSNAKSVSLRKAELHTLAIRFRFVEMRSLSQAVATKLFRAQRVDWNALPDPTAMAALVPSSVADALYEATKLRRLPVKHAVRRVAGPSSAPTEPAELAAVAAFKEIAEAAELHRRPLRVEHLVESARSMALQAVSLAKPLINAAFNPNIDGGVVRGNDVIWHCLPGASTARLSLRHLQAFGTAPYKQIFDDFSNALLREARNYKGRRVAAPSQSVEAARVFARVRSLSPPTSFAPCAVASAFAAPATDELYANAFADQRTFVRPEPEPGGPKEVAAGWASRCFDPEPAAEWGIEDGIDGLVQAMNRASTVDAAVHYYCPMAARLGRTPPPTPFSERSQLLWIDLFAEACTRISGKQCPGVGTADVTINARFLFDESLTGLARHPLVITLTGRTVTVPLAKRPSTQQLVATEPVADLSDAKSRLRNADVMQDVLDRSGRARVQSYNADRFRYALALAESHIGPGGRVVVSVPEDSFGDNQALPLAMGLALLQAETGAVLQLCVSGATRLQEAERAARSAMAAGCKAVALYEACVALS